MHPCVVILQTLKIKIKIKKLGTDYSSYILSEKQSSEALQLPTGGLLKLENRQEAGVARTRHNLG